jgi:hypothetical protein
MGWARAGQLVAVLIAAGSLAAGAAATNQPGTTYVDQADGFSVTIPTIWKLVPRSKAAVTTEIAELKKKKADAELAATYTSIISTAAGVSGLTAYRFQAFEWPVDPDTPILTEVSIGIVKTAKAYGKKDLPAIGATYANALSAAKGSKVVVPKTITLPVGPAEFIEGTIPAGTGLDNGIELYLIPHGKRVYELSFQVDATLLGEATLFTAIAHDFKFV